MTEKLWCVHVEGPDDLIPAHSIMEAHKLAATLRAWAASSNVDTIIGDIRIIEWPYSDDGHEEALQRRMRDENEAA